MVHMERALYSNPEQDLRALWWDLVERFQWVRRPEGRNAPDWAAKIHFSVAPVYYHNYQLGEMLASQLQDHLLRDVLGGGAGAWTRYVRSPDVGAFLRREFYGPGKRLDWRELMIFCPRSILSFIRFFDFDDPRTQSGHLIRRKSFDVWQNRP